MSNLELHLGTRVRADEGFRDLRKGQDYYFFSHAHGCLRFIFFELIERSKTKSKVIRRTEMRLISRMLSLQEDVAMIGFEHGMLKTFPASDPPFTWMGNASIGNPKLSESHQAKLVSPHFRIAKARLADISPAVEELERILLAARPEKLLNQIAASSPRKINTVRFRSWFFAYVLSGQNEASLVPRIFSPWTSARKASFGPKKRGRPSLIHGKEHGHNLTPEMRATCKKAYDLHKGLGVPLSAIYQKGLTEQFGCLTRKSEKGYEFFHPQGKPFPSRNQFRHAIMQLVGRQQVKLDKVGPMKMLNDYAVDRGSYTENIGYAFQEVEDDGAYIWARPRCIYSGRVHPPLVAVVLVDLATSAKIGIGFSSGVETAQAYRDAHFCSAISKVEFCRLFGLQIEPDDWPMEGVGPSQLRDRGPGSTKLAQAKNPQAGPVFRRSTPTACGRAKPTVETSHPKVTKNQEPTNFPVSNLSTVQLAIEVIKDVLKHNRSLNVSDKIPPSFAQQMRVATPNSLYRSLVSHGRSVGNQIPFTQAVRDYLGKSKCSLTRQGVKWQGHLYTSSILRSSGLLERIPKGESIEVDVYALGLVTQRYIWIDVDGSLIEVELSFKISVSNADLQVSLEDLKQRAETLKLIDARTEAQRAAARADVDELARKQTGIGSQRVRFQSGSPPSRKLRGQTR